MSILILIPATVLAAVWLVLLFMVNQDDWITAAYAQVVDNRIEADRLRQKDAEREEELARLNDYHRLVYDTVAPLLSAEEQAWLAAATAPLHR